jgi:subtilisin-like proprotein convertase family protein
VENTPEAAVATEPLVSGCSIATHVFTNNTVQPIPDAVDSAQPGVISSTIHVVTPGAYLWQVMVTTNITHTYNGDLDIFLISPAGTLVTLSSNNGGSLDDIFAGTTWSDKAGETDPPGPVTLATFADKTVAPALVPEEAMGAFVGENPNGDWQLLIRDEQRQEAGVLVSWSINITTLTSAPIITTDRKDVSINQPIPDNGTPVSIDIPLADLGGSLGGLTLTTFITHPASGNLVIQLITPGGITITVSQNRGASYKNIFNGTVWTDKAGETNPPGPVTDTGFGNGVVETPLVVEEALSAAYGTNPGGTWHLRVRDTIANGVTGALLHASLEAASVPCLGLTTH